MFICVRQYDVRCRLDSFIMEEFSDVDLDRCECAPPEYSIFFLTASSAGRFFVDCSLVIHRCTRLSPPVFPPGVFVDMFRAELGGLAARASRLGGNGQRNKGFFGSVS